MICDPLAPEEGATEHDQRKAEAIAARRAARAPWQNAHVDRLHREREARETAKEYRRAQSEAGKQCSSCGETLPLSSYSPAFRDRPTARCKACVAAATRERYNSDLDRARSRKRNRPPVDPEKRSRRAAARVERKAQCPRETQERQRKALERQRESQERIAHLTSLLMGTNPQERISNEESWTVTTNELRALWLTSGDKQCTSCKTAVPPTAMLPPGPANFYTGKCRSCARAEYDESHLRVFGRFPDGTRLIVLRDGSRITVAEMARRCREAR